LHPLPAARSTPSPSAEGQILLSNGTLDDLRRQYPDLYRHVRSAIVFTGEVAPAPAEDEDSLDYLLIAKRQD